MWLIIFFQYFLLFCFFLQIINCNHQLFLLFSFIPLFILLDLFPTTYNIPCWNFIFTKILRIILWKMIWMLIRCTLLENSRVVNWCSMISFNLIRSKLWGFLNLVFHCSLENILGKNCLPFLHYLNRFEYPLASMNLLFEHHTFTEWLLRKRKIIFYLFLRHFVNLIVFEYMITVVSKISQSFIIRILSVKSNIQTIHASSFLSSWGFF